MAIWLSEADVRALLNASELMTAMEAALSSFSAGQVVQPLRSVLDAGPGVMATMPMVTPGAAMGVKLVTVFPRNGAKGLPTHQAVIALFDAETGAFLATMDGRYITEARTAAVSALSLKYLAAPGKRKVCILGSGIQAHSHYTFLRQLGEFDELRCWSPTPARRAEFARQHAPAIACDSAGEAVRGANIVVLATSSATPVISAAWVSAGAHVISVGACRPHEREIDPELLAASKLFVDSRESALRESGDVIGGIRDGRFTQDHIVAELGSVISGTSSFIRAESDVTVFKSLGLAVEDVMAAGLVYRRALSDGIGTPLF